MQLASHVLHIKLSQRRMCLVLCLFLAIFLVCFGLYCSVGTHILFYFIFLLANIPVNKMVSFQCSGVSNKVVWLASKAENRVSWGSEY